MTQPAFQHLGRGGVQALLEPEANALRKHYLDILTLLQDLLGRYSSNGNATVFANVSEIDHLVYESFKKIQPHDWESKVHGIRGPGQVTFLDPFLFRSDLRKISSLASRLRVKKGKHVAHTIQHLRAIVAECASANIANAHVLRSACEKSKKPSKATVEALDNFHDNVLDEYELLRKASRSGSGSPQANRRTARSETAKEQR